MGGLAVNAHDGLGAGETDEHPAAVFELELEAIHGDQAGNLQPANGFRICVQDGGFAVFAIAGEGGVDAVVEMLANLVEQHLEQLGGLFAGADHEIEHVQARQDAIPLGDVAAEGVAAAFLAADEGVGLDHLGSHIFETNPGLNDRDVIECAQFVEHGGGGKSLDDGAALAANLQQVISQQGVDPQLVDEFPVLVADAAAVGVAVGDEQDVGVIVNGGFQPDIDVRRDGFGAFHLREGGIALVVDLEHFCFATCQQAGEIPGSIAPHGVHHDGEAGIPDGLEIDQLVDVVNVGRMRIEFDDVAGLRGSLEGGAVNVCKVVGDEGLRSCSSPAGSMAPPVASRTLKPLSVGGLCEAVMLSAPAAPIFTTA